jgi:hypothetical protein
MIGLNIPKTEEGRGPYSEDSSSWTPEVIGPDGGFSEGWDQPDDIEAIVQEYMRRADDFKKETTLASTTFNNRMKDWTQDEAGRPSVARLLSQNFWSTFDKTIYGGSGGIAPIDSSGDARNILAAIDHRLNAIADIQAGVDVRRLSQGDEMRGQVLEMQTDALSSLTGELWDSNPGYYMRNLSLVYSGDPDLMMINPLGVEYPEGLKRMLGAYAETGTAASNIPSNMREWVAKNSDRERPEQGVDPMDMLRQKWPLIDIGPDAMHRATWMRKQVRDISHFQGLTSPKTNFEVPMPEAQLHHVGDYGEEINRLQALREAMMRMVETKLGAGMEDSSWEQVASKPGLVEGMDSAVTDALTKAGQLYGSDKFVTKDDRMSAAYDIGQATKMEIFGKILYLAQAWKAFLAHRMPQITEQQGIKPEELGMGVLSQIRIGLTRLAAMADDIGSYGIADAIDSSLAV